MHPGPCGQIHEKPLSTPPRMTDLWTGQTAAMACNWFSTLVTRIHPSSKSNITDSAPVIECPSGAGRQCGCTGLRSTFPARFKGDNLDFSSGLRKSHTFLLDTCVAGRRSY